MSIYKRHSQLKIRFCSSRFLLLLRLGNDGQSSTQNNRHKHAWVQVRGIRLLGRGAGRTLGSTRTGRAGATGGSGATRLRSQRSRGRRRTVVVVALQLVRRRQLVKLRTREVLGSSSKAEVTVNLVQSAPVQVTKVTTKGSSTLDDLQVWNVQVTQHRVVKDVELTINLGKVWQVQGGQVVVSEDLERRTSEGQGVEGNRVKGVVTQDERAVDVLQVRDIKRSNILNGQVSSRLQVWQLDGGLVVVERQSQTAGDLLQVSQVNRGDVLVVVNVQNTDALELQKLVDGSQSSVRQGKGCDVGKTGTQVKGSERWQRDKRQLVSRGKLQKLNVVQGGQSRQGQRTSDVSDGTQVNSSDGRRVENSDITSNSLDVTQVQSTNLVTRDGNRTVQSRTRVQLRDGGSGSDGGGHGARVGRRRVGRTVGSNEGSQESDKNRGRKHSECWGFS